MGFKHLEHTADAKLRAYGADFPSACVEACRGFTSVMTDVDQVKPKMQHKISVEAKSKERLLRAFLDELVFLKDTKGFVASDAKLELNGPVLSGILLGDSIANYERAGDVKAVTLHGLKIEEKQARTVLEFVLDV